MLHEVYSKASLRGKIVGAFHMLFLSLALTSTLIVGFWLSASLDDGMAREVDGVSSLVLRAFQQTELDLRTHAKLIADSDDVRGAALLSNSNALMQRLLPTKATLDLHMVKVVDALGRTLIDVRHGTSKEGTLRDEKVISLVLSRMYLSELVTVEGESETILVGFAPIKGSDGLLGGVILGFEIAPALLERMTEGTHEYVAAFDGTRLFATTLPEGTNGSWQPPPVGAPPTRIVVDGHQYVAKSERLSVHQADTALTLVVLTPVAPLDQAKWELWIKLGAFFVLAILLAAVAGAWVARSIVRPVSSLMHVTERLAIGDLAARAPVSTGDEIGRLGNAFNFMAEQLADRDEKLSSTLAELARRHEELEASHSQLRRLNEVSNTITANLDLDEVLRRLGKAMLETLGASSLWILTVSTDGQRLEGQPTVTTLGSIAPEALPELFGADSESIPIDGKANLLTRVVALRKPAFFADISKLGAEELHDILGRVPASFDAARSLAVIPLILGDEAIGATVLADRLPRILNEQEQATAMVFASEAALTIKNARLYQEVKRLSEIDPLTGISNYRKVYQILQAEMDRADRYHHPVSIMMVDVDDFKLFNDTYGHLCGDKVLREIAGLLHVACRSTDIVGRCGGDEFIVVLPETAADQAHTVAGRFLEKLAGKRVSVGGIDDLPICCSIGIATYPREAANLQDLLRVADGAMYDAKRSGGNRASLAGIRIMETLKPSDASWTMLDSFITAVDNKDRYTRLHSDMVTSFALALARELKLPSIVQDQIRIAGPLHDVGKLGVPDHILRKPGPLSPEEREVIEQHPVFGALIVQYVPHIEDVLDGVRHHHERFDGKGYPNRLKGKDIPLLARVLAVADSFAAMVTDRPYRKALTHEQAMDELSLHAGTQFDPDVVEAFSRLIRCPNATPENGSLTRTTSTTATA